MIVQRISPLQYIWLTSGFLFGSAALIFIGGEAGKDAWVSLLGGMLEFMVLGLSFLLLARRFPGMGVSAINDAVWGPWFGKVFTLAFIWYTLTLSSIVMVNFHDFIQLAVLNGIPDYPLDFITSVVLIIAVLHGIEVIGRFTGVVIPLIIAFVTFVTVLSIPYWDPNNIRPVIATPIPKLLAVSHGLASFPYGETVALMAVMPFVAEPGRIIRHTYMAAIIATLVMMLITIRNVGVLGDAVGYFAYSSYTAVKVVNVAGFFTRMELFIALNNILTSGIKAAVLFYAAAVTTKDLLGLASMRAIVLPFGILLSLLTHDNFPSSVHNILYASKIYPYYAPNFEYIIPLLTLIVAVARKRKGPPVVDEPPV